MIDYSQYTHIHSVKYRKYISPWQCEIQKIPHFYSSGVFIVLPNYNYVHLSMNTDLVIDYNESGLIRGDLLFRELTQTDKAVSYSSYYATADINQMQIENLRQRYNINQPLVIYRECDDCYIAATCNTHHVIHDAESFHAKYIDAFEQWLDDFLNSIIDIYGSEMPTLRTTRFFIDKQFREQVIHNRDRSKKNINLSYNECATLYWGMLGKTAAESATIIGLSTETIATYRKRAIKKLNASNLTHAVLLAKKFKLIV